MTYLKEAYSDKGTPFGGGWPPTESVEIIRQKWDEGVLVPNGAYADFNTRVINNPSHQIEYTTASNGWAIVDNKTLGLKILVEPGSGSRFHVIEDYYKKLQ